MAKPGAWDHPKVRKLARVLEIRQYAAFGLFSRVLDVTARLTPRGDIGRVEPCDIAHELAWEGDPEVLILAFVEAGLLDWYGRGKKKVLIVHDWAEHAGDLVHAKLARARLRFITGEFPNLRKLEAEERKLAEEFYRDLELKTGRPAGVRVASGGRSAARSPPKPNQIKPDPPVSHDSSLRAVRAVLSAPLGSPDVAQGARSGREMFDADELNEADRGLWLKQSELAKRKAR